MNTLSLEHLDTGMFEKLVRETKRMLVQNIRAMSAVVPSLGSPLNHHQAT